MEKEEDKFIVQFPDMTNVLTFGYSEEEALIMAKEALESILECEIARNEPVPPPSFGTGGVTEGFPITVAPHIVLALHKSNSVDKTEERLTHSIGKNLQVRVG
jgi:predicted RNase H-like HicB family nuclease